MNICLNCGSEHSELPGACSDCGGPVVGVRNSVVGDNYSGRVLGDKYVLLRSLGRGGMGSVYQAKHRPLDKLVAIKIMNVEIATNKTALERFYAEARNAARLEHPNNLKVFDFGHEPDGLVYIVMEIARGRPLSRLPKPMQLERALLIASQIGAALQEAHDIGLVHRDLKPDNVMVTSIDGGDFSRVLDYGIAKLANSSTGLTRSGVIVGTPQYLSPEQAMGEKVDHRCDVYALGVMLYELLTGQLPFQEETVRGFAKAHVTQTPRPPSELVNLPEEVEALILECLAKLPGDRPASMDEVRRRIDELTGGPMAVDLDPKAPDTDRDLRSITLEERTPGSLASVSLGGAAAPQPDSIIERFRRRPARVWAAGVSASLVLALALIMAFDPFSRAEQSGPIDIPPPQAVTTRAAPQMPEEPLEAAPTITERAAEQARGSSGELAAGTRSTAEQVITALVAEPPPDEPGATGASAGETAPENARTEEAATETRDRPRPERTQPASVETPTSPEPESVPPQEEPPTDEVDPDDEEVDPRRERLRRLTEGLADP